MLLSILKHIERPHFKFFYNFCREVWRGVFVSILLISLLICLLNSFLNDMIFFSLTDLIIIITKKYKRKNIGSPNNIRIILCGIHNSITKSITSFKYEPKLLTVTIFYLYQENLTKFGIVKKRGSQEV